MKRSLVTILVMLLIVSGLAPGALMMSAEPEVAEDTVLKMSEFHSIGGGGRLG